MTKYIVEILQMSWRRGQQDAMNTLKQAKIQKEKAF
jgi:hypothetical protein